MIQSSQRIPLETTCDAIRMFQTMSSSIKRRGQIWADLWYERFDEPFLMRASPRNLWSGYLFHSAIIFRSSFVEKCTIYGYCIDYLHCLPESASTVVSISQKGMILEAKIFGTYHLELYTDNVSLKSVISIEHMLHFLVMSIV